MVLILIFTSLFLIDGPMITKYQKETSKEIKKHLQLKNYKLDNIKCNIGELYRIKTTDKNNAYLLVSEVAACSLGGCPAYKAIETNASSEYFDMMAIIDHHGKIISIKILDYFSDYGYEITSKKYLKKFVGLEPCTIYEGNDHIDAISGATISSFALEGKLGQLCEYINSEL